jgi:Notch-like protein
MISSRILKLSGPFISSPIKYICNRMLIQGVFPDRLRYATVIPLYKRGNRGNMSNYRPISLLTSFSKIFEMVMQKRNLLHLSKYKILSNEQYGFRSGLKTGCNL